MRTRGSEAFIVLPLLPIFLIGLFPMLLLSLLGPAGLIILGILVASAGLTDILDASGTFSEQVIVHGYARGTERNGQRTALRSEMRFAAVGLGSPPFGSDRELVMTRRSTRSTAPENCQTVGE
jgi:hypothetical protein